MKTKKLLSLLLCVAMFLSTLSMVVFGEDIEPNVIKEFNFTNSNEGWYTFGGGNLLWDEDKGYVYANNKSKSWVSPAVNIYEYIKAGGAGTYCINAIVDYNFSLENSVTARMVIRSDREYSFIPEHNGLFYKGIGIKTILYDSPWTEMSGTFKVTEEDLRASSGEFILCFDSLFDNFAEGMLKVDDVTICKLDSTNITNGDFWHNEIGWRNWGGFGNFYASYQAESGGFFNFAHYMKASTYGSIACNVDQILEHYGCTTYTLRLSMKIPAESYEHLDRMCFFLSAGDNSFHYNMGYKTKAQLSTSVWTDISININMNTVPNGQTKNLYELLSPDTNEVFFRMEYRSDNSTQSSDEGYLITRVNFTPLSQVGSISFNKKATVVAEGWSGYLDYTATPSDRNITWESSNTDIALVNSGTGRIYALKAGTVTITAYFENGIYARCILRVYNNDPLDPTNIISIKKQYIVSSDKTHLIAAVKTFCSDSDIFYARNENNGVESIQIITSGIKGSLDALDAKYCSYTFPERESSKSELLAHFEKQYSDKLVNSGKIEKNSIEYYGIWYQNYCTAMDLLFDCEQKLNNLSKYSFVFKMFIAGFSYGYTSTIISAGQYQQATTDIRSLTDQMVKNKTSDYVMLGTDANGIRWYEEADKRGYSYFYSENYDNLVSQYGKDTMFNANKEFIYDAKLNNKVICFSHDPIDTLERFSSSTFAMEIRYIKELYGISIADHLYEENNLWYLDISGGQ